METRVLSDINEWLTKLESSVTSSIICSLKYDRDRRYDGFSSCLEVSKGASQNIKTRCQQRITHVQMETIFIKWREHKFKDMIFSTFGHWHRTKYNLDSEWNDKYIIRVNIIIFFLFFSTSATVTSNFPAWRCIIISYLRRPKSNDA